MSISLYLSVCVLGDDSGSQQTHVHLSVSLCMFQVINQVHNRHMSISVYVFQVMIQFHNRHMSILYVSGDDSG